MPPKPQPRRPRPSPLTPSLLPPNLLTPSLLPTPNLPLPKQTSRLVPPRRPRTRPRTSPDCRSFPKASWFPSRNYCPFSPTSDEPSLLHLRRWSTLHLKFKSLAHQRSWGAKFGLWTTGSMGCSVEIGNLASPLDRCRAVRSPSSSVAPVSDGDRRVDCSLCRSRSAGRAQVGASLIVSGLGYDRDLGSGAAAWLAIWAESVATVGGCHGQA